MQTKFVILAWSAESSTAIAQTTQRKEKPTEESTGYKEGKSRCWQKGCIELFNLHC